MRNFGWKGSFELLTQTETEEIVDALCSFIYGQPLQEALVHPREESTLSQIKAWRNCIADLKNQLPAWEAKGEIIFEYELPRSGGRRPDVLLLTKGQLIVLEFKGYPGISDAEKAQASLYVRDLEEYHSIIQTHNVKVRGAVVYPTTSLQADTEYQIYQVPHTSILSLLSKLPDETSDVTSDEFVLGSFQALPSIIETAQQLFRHEPLVNIKNIKSNNFEEVFESALQIIKEAEETKTHHLLLISGVPGAGKTYLGLRLAYEVEQAVYLSGNGPLVSVLQDALDNKSFVQALYNYKRSFQKGEPLEEHVLIFDEAQRAWDAAKMGGSNSEPDVIMQIAQQKSWSVVVGLIGNGQEIHTGEEGGLALWNQAVAPYAITIHTASNEFQFTNAASTVLNEHLHLQASIRTHNALQYFQWVEAYLAGDNKRAAALAKELQRDRFILKEMESLDEAKEFVRSLYQNSNKTVGIVTSSRAGYSLPFKTFGYRDQNYVAFYNHPKSPYYSNRMEYAVTEFQVQGLELDFAIVYWGDDLTATEKGWKFQQLNNDAKDPYQMKLNVYRVLLTRGRDGVIIVRKKN
ncbi:DNA/RNA helicase domain-containing protein [Sporosarcina sp. Te-1]|uniref:DNA/RNA helicase domain-containing protein n=1 Tax=Sporosarcina sp. Te-1 TaxID=2818390 RepID=UPI001A9EFC6C|nr:DNA/RNA helicase domain-containing protein [Sporosarcina sp. Te-1]QTD39472.1 DUF2075 domain-containing protein [Sporosarcina sp. Te-1]